ncbi:MAG: adenylate/guanylate cyclase domain-containing protein [Candidatus Rokubacteria bacterium]|nr:adenylate/guanylate cyclase domain-containing protein [Candidatus Rokubacteria bacterium]
MPQASATTGLEMRHPATPFYREWTFHVLLGTVTAGAGFVVYRLARAQRRATRVPTGLVSEAVLVVDLVDSTRLATHYGNAVAMRARNVLAERNRAAAEARDVLFMETTGDGCLMTFPTVARAVESAVALLDDLATRPPDLTPGPSLEVRAGVAYGEILLDGSGARHGAPINKAFRLIGVSRESLARVADAGEAADVPDRDRILLDEEAANELPTEGRGVRFVGFFRLKGFPGLHGVYDVRRRTRS